MTACIYKVFDKRVAHLYKQNYELVQVQVLAIKTGYEWMEGMEGTTVDGLKVVIDNPITRKGQQPTSRTFILYNGDGSALKYLNTPVKERAGLLCYEMPLMGNYINVL